MVYLKVFSLLLLYFLFNLKIIDVECEENEKIKFIRSILSKNGDNNKKFKENATSVRLKREVNLNNSEIDNADNDDVRVTVAFNYIGFERIESIPVVYPEDICVFYVDNVQYAASLHTNGESKKSFVIFKKKANEYVKVYSISTPLAVSMDCVSFNDKSYFAILYNHTSPTTKITDGSPIYVFENDEIAAVQFFTMPNLNTMKLRTHGSDIYLLLTFKDRNSQFCLIYKWFSYHFNVIDQIPCRSAQTMELFTIESEMFVAVLNSASNNFGEMKIFSEIYKFAERQGKFLILQKIKLCDTSMVSDVRYFEVETSNEEIHRFLIFTNVKESDDLTDEVYSIVYKYSKEQFFPFQKLFLNSVKQVLPVQVGPGKFIMLIACENQDLKYFEYDGWKFKESSVKLTEGVLRTGVSQLRILRELNEMLVVVANKHMFANETNIYKPLFKRATTSKLSRSNILKWAKNAYERISKVDIDEMKTKVEDLIAKKRLFNTPSTTSKSQFYKIKQAITNMFIYPPKNMSKDFWETLKLLQKATMSLEKKFNAIKSKILSRTKSSDQEQTSAQFFDARNSESELLFDEDDIVVDTLTIKQTLNAKNVNNQSQTKLKFEIIDANKIVINSTSSSNVPTFHQINAKSVSVSNLINDIELEDLQKNSLRKFDNQSIRAEFVIDKVIAKNIVNKESINDMNTSKLIQINEGSYVINQDVQFAEPVYANNLIVNERINNIHVFQGKLDVLLTDSKEPQNINSFKQFESVKLLEPVTIGGKIFGSHIDRMNPILTITDDINLQGDFIINGDVLIRKLLSAENILIQPTFGNNSNKNIAKVLQQGLKINEQIIGVDLKFNSPIFSNNLLVRHVNGKDVTQFVKNTNDIQTIYGKKIFKSDLTVDRGFCEANFVNGFDVEELSKRIFRKIGDQNITEVMHFKKIIVERLNSSTVYFGETPMHDLLSKTKSQEIHGSVEIENCIADNVEVKHLKTSKRIFNYNLQHENILEDIIPTTNGRITINEEKFIDKNLNVKNLIIKKRINLQPMEKIEELLSQLSGEIRFSEPVRFLSNMKISNLTFDGRFNGIPSNEFGKHWLLSETNQEFTASQSFSKVKCEDDLLVLGKINDYTLNDLITRSYWITRPEHVENITFTKEIAFPNDSITIDGFINGINFTSDVLLKKGMEFQKIDSHLLCDSDVNVSDGQIKILSTLNQFNILDMLDIFNGNISKIAIRNAFFEKPPKFIKFNSIDVNELLNKVWFKDQPVTLQGNLKFSNVVFENVITSQGHLNDVNLANFKETYLSKSDHQIVNSAVKFHSNVVFKDASYAHNMTFKGRIIDVVSKSSINFNEFVSKTLTVSGAQTITGLWNIFEARVTDNLNKVRINGLNLVNDVMRYDTPNMNNITAQKYLQNASIQNILCEPSSHISGVDVSEWIRKTVFTYENFTIQGTTTIDSILVYNDIHVMQLVNGIAFDENTLLLKHKDQIIRGNVQITTKYPEAKRILPLTFEKLYATTVNGIDVNYFFNNAIEMNEEIKLNGSLKFTSHLIVRNVNVNGQIFGVNINDVISKNLEFSKFVEKVQKSIIHVRDNEKRAIGPNAQSKLN